MRKFNEKELQKMHLIGKAAAKLFEKNGYLETSLKDISNAVRLSKGGIYHYFSNKHEILYFIIDTYMDVQLTILEDDLKEIPDSASKIQFVIFRHLKLFNKNIAECKALLIDAHNLPSKYFKVIAVKEKKYIQIVTNVLSEFFDQQMPMDKLKAISYTMFGMCNSIMYWYDPTGPVKLEELSKICFDIFLKGVSSYKNSGG